MVVIKKLDLLIVIAGSLLLFLSTSAAADDSKPVLRKDPYVFYSGALSPLKEIVEGRLMEAFRRVGLTMKLVQVESAQRALVMANTEGDGDALRVPNLKEISPQNTENLVQIPEPILYNSMSVYSKKHDFPVNGWGALKGYSAGFRNGMKILEKNIPSQQRLPTADRLFQMLASERVDVVVEWDLIAAKTIKDLNLISIKKLSPAIHVTETYAYIHKKHQGIIPQISGALVGMKKDGTFEKIKADIVR